METLLALYLSIGGDLSREGRGNFEWRGGSNRLLTLLSAARMRFDGRMLMFGTMCGLPPCISSLWWNIYQPTGVNEFL